MSTSTLDKKIHTGKRVQPRRILLYGTEGIGKSTFGSEAPGAVFIPTEDGLADIDCASFPKCERYEDFLQCITDLYMEKHNYKTVVVDAIGSLESLIWNKVCREVGKKNIEDIGYQKGYIFALTYWNEVLAGLQALRDTRGMTVILIAHAKVDKFNDPDGEDYDFYSPDVHKKALAVLTRWCDEILFAKYVVFKTVEGDGKNKKAKGVGQGERIFLTQRRPTHYAKNRLGLPYELPFVLGKGWSVFAQFLPGQKKTTSSKKGK